MSRTIELRVYGMTCDDCVKHVSSGLKNANGITGTSVSLQDGMAVVSTIDTENPDELIKRGVLKGQYSAQARSVKND